jgi:hypothetical protein
MWRVGRGPRLSEKIVRALVIPPTYIYISLLPCFLHDIRVLDTLCFDIYFDLILARN